MSVLAMKQALEVIEAAIESGDWQIDGACDPSMAIHSLHEAIAEAEKQEPVAWIVDGEIKVRLDMAGKLYYSETNVYTSPVHAIDISQERVDETAKREHEPVAWREAVGTVTCYYDYNEDGRGEPLYAAPVAQCTYPKCQVTNGCVGACSKTAPPKQEPYGYFRYDIKLDAWVQNKENTQGVAFYTTPSKPYDPMENNADYERGFIDGRADQMKSSVDKAVNRMAQREWVGLDGDIPDLGLVTEEFYNGMLCAEDILRKRNT
jgi:hypothetical protein